MNVNRHLIGGRSNETPLTEKGVEQARSLAAYFLAQGIMPDRIFASPALRTLATADAVTQGMNLSTPVLIADEIQEMDQGQYVGLPRVEVYTEEVLDEIEKQGKNFKLPGGESMNDVGERMLRWVNTQVLVEQTRNVDRTFVFGHGIAIRSLASYIEGWSHKVTYDSVTENTSLTLFSNEGDGWKLEQLGATPHLQVIDEENK